MNNPQIIVKNAPFKHFCMSIGAIPTSYLDSLDYYETLLWLIKYLEETIIPTVNNNGEAVSELQTLYTQLKDFVENYFANLDVQEEINNKLDELVEDGTFENILLNYTKISKVYDTTVNLLDDTSSLVDGMKIRTLGYYNINDGGGAEFYCREKTNEDVADNGTIYSVSETLVIEMVKPEIITPEMLGAIGDGETDDTTAISNCTKFNHIVMNKNYLTQSQQFTFENAIIEGKGKLINGVLIVSDCIIKNITLYNTYRTAIALPSETNNNKCFFENVKINTTNLPLPTSNYTAVGYGIGIASPNFHVVIKNCYFTKTTGIGAVYAQADGYLDVDSCEFFDLGSRAVHIRANKVDGFFRNSKAHYLGVNYVETERESVACGIYGHSTGNFKVLNNDIQYSVANCIEGRFTEIAGNYCAHTFVNMAYPNPTGSYQGVWLDEMELPSLIHDNIFEDVSHSVSIGGNSNFEQGVEIYNNITNNTKAGYETFYVGNTPAKRNINIHDNPNSTLYIGNNSLLNTDILPININSQDRLDINYTKKSSPKLYAYAPLNCSNIPEIDFDTDNNNFKPISFNLPTYNQNGLLYLHLKVRTTGSIAYTNNGVQHNVTSSPTGIIELEKMLINNGTNIITMNARFTELEIEFIEV